MFKILEENDNSESFERFPESCFSSPGVPIRQEYIHKHHKKNIAICEPIVLSQKDHIFRTKVNINKKNDFFFDHEYDHVPGMLLTESSRQFGTAIGHLYFDIPFGSSFILNTFSVNFDLYADLHIPTYIDAIVNVCEKKRGIVRKLEGTGVIHQSGKKVGSVNYSTSIIPDYLLKRLRKNSHAVV